MNGPDGRRGAAGQQEHQNPAKVTRALFSAPAVAAFLGNRRPDVRRPEKCAASSVAAAVVDLQSGGLTGQPDEHAALRSASCSCIAPLMGSASHRKYPCNESMERRREHSIPASGATAYYFALLRRDRMCAKPTRPTRPARSSSIHSDKVGIGSLGCAGGGGGTAWTTCDSTGEVLPRLSGAPL